LKPVLRTKPLTVSFVFYLPTLFIPKFVQSRMWMNVMQITSILSKTVIGRRRKQ